MEGKNQYIPEGAEAIRFTLRLTFYFDGKDVELIEKVRLEKIAPASVSPRPIPGENSGFWIELHDPQGNVIFHRVMRNPLANTAEHYLPDGTIEFLSATAEADEFEILVPDLSAAQQIVLFSSPFDQEFSHEPAVEIARFSLIGDFPGEDS